MNKSFFHEINADAPHCRPPAALEAITWRNIDGPLLVTLPGAGCSPSVFSKLRADGWSIQPVDWAQPPHCPHSCAPLPVAERLANSLRERIQDRRAGPVVLLGYSVGGAIALLTALQHDMPVAGVVVGNTGAHSQRHGDPALPQQVREAWTEKARQDFLRTCFIRPPPAPLWRQLCAYLAKLPPHALLQSLEGLRALDLRPSLSKLACPVLVLHGEFDRRRRVEDALELASYLVDARLQLLPGGHTPMVDCPDQYLSALQAFLTSVLARDTGTGTPWQCS